MIKYAKLPGNIEQLLPNSRNTMDEREGIIKHLKKFFAERASFYGVEMVFLFGSWATGIPRQDSDIDIAVVFRDELSEEGCFGRMTDISVLLSTELKREVNVITIYKDFRKPMLYYNAIISGIPLWILDGDQFVKLKTEALFHMEDYSIFGPAWRYEATRRNLEGLRDSK